MFKENRNNMISKVLSSVVCCFIKNYVCADYMCCPQTKIHVSNKEFKNKTYSYIPVIGIPELLINIISFREFYE